jgi:Mlc titration factor MtfA (ptsG expression regulator)
MLRLLIVLALLLGLLWWLRRRRRRRSAQEATLACDPTAVLQSSVHLYRRLPPALQARLLPRLEEFIRRIPFTGARGLQVTDDMRVIVAAQACIPTLGSDEYPFDSLHGVTLHPDEFVVEEQHEDESTGVVTEGYRALSGQSLDTDRVVLSWRDVQDAETREDGYNVVIHETTHFLEASRPAGDAAAHAALAASHAELCRAVDHGEPTLLDPYGAEDLTEFLAVAAEFFFERPRDLREQHPTVYVLLRDSFQLDPAEWPPV